MQRDGNQPDERTSEPSPALVGQQLSLPSVINVERLWRVEDVADRLALGRSKVYQLIGSGNLPARRIGSAVRVRESDLVAFMKDAA